MSVASSESLTAVARTASSNGSRRSSIPGYQRNPGEQVDDKYDLVRPLGRGGMGEVWLARHRVLKSSCAIKFLDVEGDAEFRQRGLERFRFEAQVSAQLARDTEHVVAVHDAGTHDSSPFIVMELVDGLSLERWIEERGALSPAVVADIVEQLAEGLAAAHRRGIVHRDVKPANVMVIERPGGAVTAKLTDFGIAKGLQISQELDRPSDTVAGILVGSPSYMSPEQLRSGEDLDARADIWALGVVAYEALTGRPPFDGDKLVELIVAISTTMPPPPSERSSGLPVAVDEWMARALAKSRDARFSSAAEMAAGLRAALGGEAPPVRVAPKPAMVVAPPPIDPARSRRHRMLGLAVLAVAGAGVLVAALTIGLAPPRQTSAEVGPMLDGEHRPPTTETSPATPITLAPVVAPDRRVPDAPSPQPTARSKAAPKAPTATPAPARAPIPPGPSTKRDLDKSEVF